MNRMGSDSGGRIIATTKIVHELNKTYSEKQEHRNGNMCQIRLIMLFMGLQKQFKADLRRREEEKEEKDEEEDEEEEDEGGEKE